MQNWYEHVFVDATVPFQLPYMQIWTTLSNRDYIYIYIYAFSRRFYPKRLTIAFRLYIFISTCVPWESNPQPFAQLTQCSTTEPHRNTVHDSALYTNRSSSPPKYVSVLRELPNKLTVYENP